MTIEDIKAEVESQTLPDSFDLPAFKNKLFVTINTLLDFVEEEERTEWQFSLMPTLYKACFTSKYVMELPAKEKVKLVATIDFMFYILNLLAELFDQEVNKNSYQLSQILRQLLIPETIQTNQV